MPLDVVRKALDEDFGLVVGHLGCLASDSADGPSFLFEPSTSALELDGPLSMLHFIDDCLAAHVNTGPDGTHLFLASSGERPSMHEAPGVDHAVQAPSTDGEPNNHVRPTVESFIAKYKKPLEQPILSMPRLRSTKVSRSVEDEEKCSPRGKEQVP